MKLFDILQIEMPLLKPEICKVHLAVSNGRENPLDVFLEDRFQKWQSWQSNRNFERPYIVSLIKVGESNRWLFAGVYSTHGFIPKPIRKGKFDYIYKTKELEVFNKLAGRLVVEFKRTGRQSYLIAENWVAKMVVSELKPHRMTIEAFPGFMSVLLPKRKLDTIVKQQIESWKSALSSVSGIYLIADTKTGRHYVGSACGAGGIWNRWVAYSETGHGDNKNLKRVIEVNKNGYAYNFHFSILEISDNNASEAEVLARESHWKNVLCSRENYGGYNAN